MGSFKFFDLELGSADALDPTPDGRERVVLPMQASYRARAAQKVKDNSRILRERVVRIKETSVYARAPEAEGGGWRYVEAQSETEYEGEEGYDKEEAEARFRAGIEAKRRDGIALTLDEERYVAHKGI